MDARRMTATLLLLTTLIAGCGGARSDSPKPGNAPPTRTEVSKADGEAALEATRSYFRLITEKNPTGALNLVSKRWRAAAGDADLLESLKRINRLQVIDLQIDTSRPHPAGAVIVRAELEVDAPNTAWNAGKNTRFVMLLKENGVWLIDALGSG